uniref:Terpene synthase n=1 Tax=Moniliophthora roreri TaxID=221103 RepID=A0A0W0FP99_MONRR
MSVTKIGKLAPFPPLPGQPYPPACNHSRWKELYCLHDEWIMDHWLFSSEQKHAHMPFMNLAGFSTWCAPATDFNRMIWSTCIGGMFFLANDYIDSGKMLEQIPGFKQVATGTGLLHLEDQAECCHDAVFKAIKATYYPRTFQQLIKCTYEWWDSNIYESFQNLDQYLVVCQVNVGMYFAHTYFRYTLDINLTDEQVNHLLMREAEGIVSDHIGLVNDLFSYAKEKITNSDDTNIIHILQDYEGLTYQQAIEVVKRKIHEKEEDYSSRSGCHSTL